MRTLAQRGRARPRPPRLPLRRLARDRQDLDGEDPRPLAQLRQRADARALRRAASRAVTIAAGTSLDVIEMDAASNRSVDDIRDLRERVGYAPAAGHWKVYILDEAHMLTREAWNAFLKTLEEPPPNTAFILATTEPHKVMPTIVDRCQRFDFQRPLARADRRGPPPGRRRRGDRDRRRRGRRDRRARPRAASATRSARSTSSSPTAASRSRPTTSSPCSASPTPS